MNNRWQAEMKYCYDFEDEPGFPGCCGSCHSDEEYDEEAYTLQRNEEYRVCCRVEEWLKERGIDVYA